MVTVTHSEFVYVPAVVVAVAVAVIALVVVLAVVSFCRRLSRWQTKKVPQALNIAFKVVCLLYVVYGLLLTLRALRFA